MPVPRQEAYRRIEASARRRFDVLARRLADGKIDLATWQERFLDILIDRHAAAAEIGRRRATGAAPGRLDEDTSLGGVVADSEALYLQGFADDIAGGRYTGEDGRIDAEAISRRSGFYAARLLGTANEAFALGSGEGESFDWVLGGAEDHCQDCPDLAAGSPYPAALLWAYPRGGTTACLFHCKCHLKRVGDGRTGFLPA